MRSVMIDIETLGVEVGSIITSIGCVEFDPKTGRTGQEFLMNIDINDSLSYGLDANINTLLWWFKQDIDAIEAMLTKPKSLMVVLQELSNFVNTIKENDNSNSFEIWSNSPTFDCMHLREVFKRVGIEVPWSYREERCLRTLTNLIPKDTRKDSSFKKGTPHNALDDCYNQIKDYNNACEALRLIRLT